MPTGVEIVSDLVDKWNARDLDAAYAHLDEDYREYINGKLVKVGRAEERRRRTTLRGHPRLLPHR
jgi:hypothetical protein